MLHSNHTLHCNALTHTFYHLLFALLSTKPHTVLQWNVPLLGTVLHFLAIALLSPKPDSATPLSVVVIAQCLTLLGTTLHWF